MRCQGPNVSKASFREMQTKNQVRLGILMSPAETTMIVVKRDKQIYTLTKTCIVFFLRRQAPFSVLF